MLNLFAQVSRETFGSASSREYKVSDDLIYRRESCESTQRNQSRMSIDEIRNNSFQVISFRVDRSSCNTNISENLKQFQRISSNLRRLNLKLPTYRSVESRSHYLFLSFQLIISILLLLPQKSKSGTIAPIALSNDIKTPLSF